VNRQSTPAADDSKPIIVALDYPSAREALGLADQISPEKCRLKVGKELFTRAGPDVIRELVSRGFDVFLDLKFHDIPNTVAGACRAAAELGCWMINVHASGGERMLEAARSSLDSQDSSPLLVAVTVLTSLDDEALAAVGIEANLEQQVLRLARLSQSCGMDGVVCSPVELALLRRECGPAFKLVTPGIRPMGSAADDQARIADPAAAMNAGASYLVIGRPITRAREPAQTLASICDAISGRKTV